MTIIILVSPIAFFKTLQIGHVYRYLSILSDIATSTAPYGTQMKAQPMILPRLVSYQIHVPTPSLCMPVTLHAMHNTPLAYLSIYLVFWIIPSLTIRPSLPPHSTIHIDSSLADRSNWVHSKTQYITYIGLYTCRCILLQSSQSKTMIFAKFFKNDNDHIIWYLGISLISLISLNLLMDS